MSHIGSPKNIVQNCNQLCHRQVTQFLSEICGLEVPALSWLIDNKMSQFYAEALITNDVLFIDIFPLPVIIVNSQGTISGANSKFCIETKKSIDRLIGHQYIEVVLNNRKFDENGRYISTILLSLETEQEFHRKYTSIDLDGSGERTRYDVSTKLLRDENGRITGVCGVLFDLDECTSLIKNLLKTKIKLLSEKPEVAFTLNKITAELDSRIKQGLQRVSKLAVELGERIGLDETRMGELRTAAILHNIGAVGIPKNIYFKDGSLTDEEKQILRNHPRIAYELFEGVPHFQKVATIILHHHENYDGAGYPDGLAGEGIPIESRIIAIVEEFVNLTTVRGNQPKMINAEALKTLENSSSSQFDPFILSEFCNLIKEKQLTDSDKYNNDPNRLSGQDKVRIYEAYTLTRFLNKMFEEHLGTYTKSINLTIPQAHLLIMLYFHEGLLVSEIARIGAWHISTVMSILSRLVKKGLIKYEPVEKGKGSYVFLTDAGRECTKKLSDAETGLSNIIPPEKLANSLTQMYAILEKHYDRLTIEQIKEHMFYANRTQI